VAPATLFEWQNSALNKLAGSVLLREAEARRHHTHNLRQRIPLASTDHLIGTERHIQALVELLAKPAAPWHIALTGIGGIGKSTLVAATALHTVLADAPDIWDDVAWVAARSSYLDGGMDAPADEPRLSVEALLEQLFDQLLPGQPKPAGFADGKALFLLSEHCRRRRCLLVVDNLESVGAAQQLLATLRLLVRPSKVLLGIREKLYMEADVTDYAVPELNEADAFTLLRWSTARQFGPDGIDDEALRQIYAVTGGNPQALRVVGGQLVSFGLDEVLADLRDIRSRRVEQMYDHIYRRAWQGLTPDERHVLLAMAAVDAEGESLHFVIQLAGLDERTVLAAMETLIVRHLVERRRLGQTVRYTMHNLTRTFLYKQIVDWEQPDEAGA
jgi:hypothetical protein